MKTLLSSVLVLSALVFSGAAHADEACSANVQSAVEAKANADGLGINVKADLPDTSAIDGGSMVSIRVPVRDITGVVIAAYSALVGETCQVMSITRQ